MFFLGLPGDLHLTGGHCNACGAWAIVAVFTFSRLSLHTFHGLHYTLTRFRVATLLVVVGPGAQAVAKGSLRVAALLVAGPARTAGMYIMPCVHS